MKYYSGTFLSDGKIYGNSLYDDTFSFDPASLSGVEVLSYDEYIQKLQEMKKEFGAMSTPTGLIGQWSLSGNTNDTS